MNRFLCVPLKLFEVRQDQELPRARGANDVAPVLMAMVSPVGAPAATPGVTGDEGAKPAAKPVTAKPVILAQAEAGVRSDVAPRMAPTRRREQLKMIEDQLLAESTLADLKKAAAREAKEGKPAQ